MAQQGRYFVDRFLLTLNRDCYLVEVEETSEVAGSTDVSVLPDWIFNSRHVIWLMADDKSLADRARDGERVRQQLIQERDELVVSAY